MKIFRWSGLLSFILFTLLLGVIGFLFLDNWARRGIESAGFAVNGAEVNVASVDLTFNPIGFNVQGVQVADAENPDYNALEIGQLQLDINLPQLFLGNVRIQQLTVADVASQTQRARTARVAPASEPADSTQPSALSRAVEEKKNTLAGALPEPASVLDEQTQNTQNAVANAEQALQQSKTDVDSAIAALPDNEAILAYQQRIAAIRSTRLDSLDAIQQAQQALQSLKTDVAEDRQAIAEVRQTVSRAVSRSRQSVSEVLAAPGQDFNQLRQDYPLNADSAVKVAQLLLGDDFFSRIEQARYWYGKAKPWLARLQSTRGADEPAGPERLSGAFIRFYDPDPTARFQLDNGRVSFTADNWPWQLLLSDLTSAPEQAVRPTRFLLQRGTDDNAALKVDGEFAREDDRSIDTFTFSGRGIDFNAQQTRIGGASIRWVPDAADVQGVVTAIDGNLDGSIDLIFASNEFSAAGDGQTARYLQTALAGIDAFRVTLAVGGTVQRPDFSLQSDLDNQLSSALAGVAKAEYDAWLQDVRRQLDARVAELKAPLDAQLNQLTSAQQQAEDQAARFENDVEAEISALEKELADRKKRLEDAAKKAAEDKLKEEAGNLTDKLKF